MNPQIWGFVFWATLIYAVLEYPHKPDKVTQRRFANYFKSVGHVLPCPDCQVAYQAHLVKHPVKTNNRTALMNWLLVLHNQGEGGNKGLTRNQFINKYTGKQSVHKRGIATKKGGNKAKKHKIARVRTSGPKLAKSRKLRVSKN